MGSVSVILPSIRSRGPARGQAIKRLTHAPDVYTVPGICPAARPPAGWTVRWMRRRNSVMNTGSWKAIVAILLLTLASSVPASAQGSTQTASLSGVAVDKDGGVLPGATVVVKNTGTGETMRLVTNGAGAFSLGAVSAGSSTVTVM